MHDKHMHFQGQTTKTYDHFELQYLKNTQRKSQETKCILKRNFKLIIFLEQIKYFWK